MAHINVEIKAKSYDQDRIREILNNNNAEYKGLDHQIDTYYQVSKGRLKLRVGNIENNLIHYNRENIQGPKQSKVSLYIPNPNSDLKTILDNSHYIDVVVKKDREIYFIGNVKFHLDNVKDLGTFVEIEAIDKDETIGKNKLEEQCKYYMELFDINKEDLISNSYSDILLDLQKGHYGERIIKLSNFTQNRK
jgi:adenylate cyclase, class 2